METGDLLFISMAEHTFILANKIPFPCFITTLSSTVESKRTLILYEVMILSLKIYISQLPLPLMI